MEPDKYHPDRSWEPQPNRDHESNKKYHILNANLDKVEEQWLELDKETVQPGNIIDINQVATKIHRPLVHQIFVAIAVVISILGPLMLLVLALVIVFKKVVSRMKTEHLNAAGFLTALPIGKVNAASFVETSGKLSFLDIALLAICGIIAIYIVICFIHWCYTTTWGKISPYRWIYGRGRTISTILLELTTNTDHAVSPIRQYEVPPECFVIIYEPNKLHAELESGVFMTTCKLEYGHAVVYVDDHATNLALPKRIKSPFFWKYKIYQMFADSSLMLRLSAVANKMNYGESILMKKGDTGPFRRSVKKCRMTQKSKIVPTQLPRAPEPTAPESTYDEVMV